MKLILVSPHIRDDYDDLIFRDSSFGKNLRAKFERLKINRLNNQTFDIRIPDSNGIIHLLKIEIRSRDILVVDLFTEVFPPNP